MFSFSLARSTYQGPQSFNNGTKWIGTALFIEFASYILYLPFERGLNYMFHQCSLSSTCNGEIQN